MYHVMYQVMYQVLCTGCYVPGLCTGVMYQGYVPEITSCSEECCLENTGRGGHRGSRSVEGTSEMERTRSTYHNFRTPKQVTMELLCSVWLRAPQNRVGT